MTRVTHGYPVPDLGGRAGPRAAALWTIARLSAVIGAAALLASAVWLSGGASDSTGGREQRQDVHPATSIGSEYAVGLDHVELVDRGRPTAADPRRGLPARPDRTIPVTLLYPARGDPGDGPRPIADAAVADGEFPLVVFSHGVTGTGDSYQRRLQNWAAAGYVVAAPTYPLTSGRGARIDDVVNQPDDVRFIIDELLQRARTPGDPLHRHVDAYHIGVAGHSLGAITTIGVTFNSCCHDPRVAAAVAISGIEFPFPNGDYADRPATPLLAVHGVRDTVVPVLGSNRLVARARPPSYYLRFVNDDHLSLLYGDRGALLDQAVIAFFDRYLEGDPRPLDDLPARVRQTDLGGFSVETGR
jgi:dienelactone hydrolase